MRNSIAIGSPGQDLEDSGVRNVQIDRVKVRGVLYIYTPCDCFDEHQQILRYNEDMRNSAYTKTCIGKQVSQDDYENRGVPRGGAWNRSVTFCSPISRFKEPTQGPRSTRTVETMFHSRFDDCLHYRIQQFYWHIDDPVTSTVSCSEQDLWHHIRRHGALLGSEWKHNRIGSCECTAENGVQGLDVDAVEF